MDTQLTRRNGGSSNVWNTRALLTVEVTEGIVADKPQDVTIEGAGSVSGAIAWVTPKAATCVSNCGVWRIR